VCPVPARGAPSSRHVDLVPQGGGEWLNPHIS
jgi:hypothetical protein